MSLALLAIPVIKGPASGDSLAAYDQDETVHAIVKFYELLIMEWFHGQTALRGGYLRKFGSDRLLRDCYAQCREALRGSSQVEFEIKYEFVERAWEEIIRKSPLAISYVKKPEYTQKQKVVAGLFTYDSPYINLRLEGNLVWAYGDDPLVDLSLTIRFGSLPAAIPDEIPQAATIYTDASFTET